MSELEGEELQQSLRLVMEDQMGRVEQERRTKDSHLMRLYCRVHLQLIGRKQSLREAWDIVVLQLPEQRGSIGRRQGMLKRLTRK